MLNYIVIVTQKYGLLQIPDTPRSHIVFEDMPFDVPSYTNCQMHLWGMFFVLWWKKHPLMTGKDSQAREPLYVSKVGWSYPVPLDINHKFNQPRLAYKLLTMVP